MSRGFIVLCLVGAVLATASASADGQLFAQRRAASVADDANAKIESYGHADVKRMCLRESRQHNCRYVGCPSIQACDPDTGCGTCETHLIGQSDVICCDHNDYDYEQSSSAGFADVVTPLLKVGTCDWDIDIYKCGADSTVDNSNADAWVDCVQPITMDNGASKVGTAWGTCYLNADSESCGHPFCDKMVLSFQGGVYLMPAYAKGTPVPPTYDIADPIWAGCFSLNEFNLTGPGAERKAGSLRRALAKTNILEQLASTSSASRNEAGPASTQYGGYGQYSEGEDPTGWTTGVAVMFTGPVTVISMGRNVEYSHGMLEYVPSWFPVGNASHAPGATALVVSPYQYDIVLSKDQDGYGYGGRFDGGRGENYYRGGY